MLAKPRGSRHHDGSRKLPTSGSAPGSDLSRALAGTALLLGLLCAPTLIRRQSARPNLSVPTVTIDTASRVKAPPQSVKSLNFESSSEGPQVCRARSTERLQFGQIRLVEVGDEVGDLGAFLDLEEQRAAARHQRCLLMASLPGCPSCSAVAFALVKGDLERQLAPLTIVRIDAEEFSDELNQLGIPSSQVPTFALLGSAGTIADLLDASQWPGNEPREFVPLLSDFLRARPPHQRGGRHSNSNRGRWAL